MKLLLRILSAVLIALCAGTVLVACGGDDEPSQDGVSLPSDFPSDDVPLLDGTVQSATGESPKWKIVVQAPAADGNALENAIAALTDDGFDESSRFDGSAARTVLVSKKVDDGHLWVNVGLSADAAASRSTVIYLVSRTD
ncbi:hypothetical protein [Gordonia shandongensis]|uniref:hypothetical protein n=1 Tax=Gordonia shandongensis TaxID=376351 RepID=UPI000421B63E|nr:hypothetical protein [Gordonia shandongensis]